MIKRCCSFLLLGQWLIVSHAFTHNQPGYFRIIMNDAHVIEGTELKLIEGTKLNLTCDYTKNTQIPIVWSSGGTNSSFHVIPVYNSTLVIESVLRNHAKQYLCTTLGYYRSIQLNILYPPDKPTIKGPSVISSNSSFNLTCFADSNPSSSYVWSYFDPKISTGCNYSGNTAAGRIQKAVISVRHSNNDIWLYCIAQNLMMPTVGPPVHSRPVTAMRHVLVDGTTSPLHENSKEETASSSIGWMAAALSGMIISSIAISVAVLQFFRMRRLLESYRELDEVSVQYSKINRQESLNTQTKEMPEPPVLPKRNISPIASKEMELYTDEKARNRTEKDEFNEIYINTGAVCRCGASDEETYANLPAISPLSPGEYISFGNDIIATQKELVEEDCGQK